MNRFIRQTLACVTLLHRMLWRQLSSNFTEIKRIMNIYKCFLLTGNLEQILKNVFLACHKHLNEQIVIPNLNAVYLFKRTLSKNSSSAMNRVYFP